MDDHEVHEEDGLETHTERVDGPGVPLDPKQWPRVDLNEVLARNDPIFVSTEPGREFIVLAPKGSHDPDLEGPDTRAPRKVVSGSFRLDENGNPEDGRYELADLPQGRSHLQQEHPKKPRIGIGSETGEILPHPRINYVQGVGVNDSDMTTEMGSAVASPWTSWTRREYNADLIGYKGLRIYDKMRKSDGTVRGTLRLAKTPVLSAQWGINPASTKKRDQNISDYVWANLQTWMTMSFPQFTTEALLMLDFGYYMFEKVFAHGEDVTNDPRAKGKIVWKKFAPRHPMDVRQWYYDINGGPLSVDMWAPPVQLVDRSSGYPGSYGQVPSTFEGGVIQTYQRWVNIPIDKLLVFTFDKEAGNIEGISILRTAYKHWFYKDNLYKIDAIQKERHGIGVPLIQLPVGYSNKDKMLAEQLGRNLRTNDRAHIVLPPGWIMEFAELKGHPVDCLPSIKHHDDMIPQGILGAFINKQQTGAGSEEQHTIFLKATRFTADVFVDVVNKYAIPQLVNFNWQRSTYPQIYAKRIGEQEDWRTQSFTLRNYVGAGIIVPDDALENQIRAEMGLPLVDVATARIVRSPSLENPQKIQPAPTEEAGPGHVVVPAQMPWKPGTPHEPAQVQPPTPEPPGTPFPGTATPKASLPRQSKPGVVKPSTGKGDRSGKGGRRGQ